MADVLGKTLLHASVCSASYVTRSEVAPLVLLPSSPVPSSFASKAFESLTVSSPSNVGRFSGGLPTQDRPLQMGFPTGKAMKWWERDLQANMKEITSAHDLVDSLLGAGNKLAIVTFFSPGCGGCRALHPKICQFAEMNPDFIFLQVNYEQHKSMCYSLNVHVLPFFRFYRGDKGRLCSFSCTNATIYKFRNALVKHGAANPGSDFAKGLEDSELLALAKSKDLPFAYSGISGRAHAPLVLAEAI